MTDGKDDFDQLRRLLKIKRYEQPPPGYFDRLPDRIVSRIEREGASSGFSWFNRVRLVLAENPITTGIFAICGILMMVIANSEYLDNYVANGGDATMALVPVQSGALAQSSVESEPLAASGLKVAALPGSVLSDGYPAIFLGPNGSSLNAFPANAQQVNFSISH